MDENNPYICPIKGDFTDCPPIMIHVGKDELLLSDSQALKKALKEMVFCTNIKNGMNCGMFSKWKPLFQRQKNHLKCLVVF